MKTLLMCREIMPNIVLLDLSFPDMDGLDIFQQLCRECINTKILIITANESQDAAFRALKAGAHGYVLKDILEQELLEAIHSVLHGDTYISPAISRKFLMKSLSGHGNNPLDALSNRELAILKRCALGHSTKLIASDLGITPAQWKPTNTESRKKLVLNSNSELVRFAWKTALSTDGNPGVFAIHEAFD
jgi:DNA-binding NarL/FixJ family response regulator